VEAACRQQLADLPAYRTAIATVVARMATAYDAPAAGRAVNRVYLLFFLPLWWEHILERGLLEPDKLEKKADEILLPRPAPPALPAPPAPPGATASPALLSTLPDAGPLGASNPGPRHHTAPTKRHPASAPRPRPPPSGGRRSAAQQGGFLRQAIFPPCLWEQPRPHSRPVLPPLLVRHLPHLPRARPLPFRVPDPAPHSARLLPRLDCCWASHPRLLGWRRYYASLPGGVAHLHGYPGAGPRRRLHRGPL
jgi:hypothetical protein